MLRLCSDWRNSKGKLYGSQNGGKEIRVHIWNTGRDNSFLLESCGQMFVPQCCSPKWQLACLHCLKATQYTGVCFFPFNRPFTRLGGRLAQIMAKQQVTDCLPFRITLLQRKPNINSDLWSSFPLGMSETVRTKKRGENKEAHLKKLSAPSRSCLFHC